MGSINKDNFVEFIGRILTNPVGVQDTKTSTAAADTLLRVKERFRFLTSFGAKLGLVPQQ